VANLFRFVFDIEDMKFDEKYNFILRDLEYLSFFIELDENGLYNMVVYNKPLDLVWTIGYYDYDRRPVDFWLDILERKVDDREYSEKQREIYIDFQREFEDQCVEKAIEFEQEIQGYIKEELSYE